ncbi:MAG: phospholipase D family protein [Negativicutes bacterium]|nr:phospholipase D family protein [Negativicutes bacterium]
MILVAGGLLFSEAVSHSEADAFEEKSRIVGIQAQSSLQAMPAAIRNPNIVNATGTIEVAFSPNGGGAATIIKAIGQAQKTIKVQAYSFTNADIAKALLDASKRGVQVRVVLDKSQETEKYTSATFLANSGVPVRIDDDFAIAHNKIMILDDETVITGSFNFTKAAEERNAENVLVIRGNKDLAKFYLQNWQWRWDASEAYKRKE